jgi:hypothetical protein
MTALAPAVRLRPLPAAALLLGGPLILAFHVLYGIGHGPTVVNQHGVVLGLTNDQWSRLSPLWMLLVAFGAAAVCRLHRARLVQGVLVTGLALHALSAWVWSLYAVGMVVLFTGTALLGVLVLRRGMLPRWSAAGLLACVAAFLPLVVAPGAFLSWTWTVLSVAVEAEDVLAVTTAAAWTLLGVGLARVPSSSVRFPAR